MKKNKVVLYSGIGVITAAVLAGSVVVLQHSQTNHLSDICPITKIESFFLGEEVASEHQKRALRQDAEDLGYSLIDVKYIPKNGVCATVLDIPTDNNTLKNYYVDSEKYTIDGKNFVTGIFSDEQATIEDNAEQQSITNLTVIKDITVGFDGNVSIETGFIKLKRK